MNNNNILARSCMLVIALVGQDLADKWWHSPNKAFDTKTPMEQFLESPEIVYNYLMWHVNGGYF